MQVKRNAEAMLHTAQNLRKLGNLNEALSLYERYLNFRPGDSAVLAEYAEAMDEMVKAQPNRIRELVAVYERILSGDPKRLEIHRKLIAIYLAHNSYPRAARQLE